MPVKVEVRMTVEAMTEFMLYHIYASAAGVMALVLGFLNVTFTISFAIKGKYLYMLLFLAFSILILVVFPGYIKNKVKKQMENAEKLKAPVTYEFDEEGIATTTIEDSGKATWDKFKKAISRKSTIILYDASKRAIILPVEQLGEEYTAVVDLIYQCMPARAVKIIRTDRKNKKQK